MNESGNLISQRVIAGVVTLIAVYFVIKSPMLQNVFGGSQNEQRSRSGEYYASGAGSSSSERFTNQTPSAEQNSPSPASEQPETKTGTTYSGHVVDASGDSVPGAYVLVTFDDLADEPFHLFTDAEGNFSVNIESGTPKLTFRVSDGDKGAIASSSDGKKLHMVMRKTGFGKIIGQVNDPRGEPAGGMTISLILWQREEGASPNSPMLGSRVRSTVVDSTGMYVFENLWPEFTYTISLFRRSMGVTETGPLTVGPDEVTLAENLVYESDGGFFGRFRRRR